MFKAKPRYRVDKNLQTTLPLGIADLKPRNSDAKRNLKEKIKEVLRNGSLHVRDIQKAVNGYSQVVTTYDNREIDAALDAMVRDQILSMSWGVYTLRN